ncbi:VOC family protein [Alkaliphilus transvaalensis]|uniref:VOC family protein n=1 Tax=Alkaliphilus transvaalensis TaxID=114628 RepID=UPI000479C5F5|nr:VOC family protein [Alkaliphilus transvaalensis]
MPLQMYLNFNGNCREAVEFYANVFNVEKQEIMLYKDVHSSEDFPLTEETKNLVMHTFLNIKGSIVMFSDVPPGMPFTVGNNISLVVNCNDIDEIRSAFEKLSVGGSVPMELQETFWSKLYGYVVDKFGVGWQFNLEEKK